MLIEHVARSQIYKSSEDIYYPWRIPTFTYGTKIVDKLPTLRVHGFYFSALLHIHFTMIKNAYNLASMAKSHRYNRKRSSMRTCFKKV